MKTRAGRRFTPLLGCCCGVHGAMFPKIVIHVEHVGEFIVATLSVWEIHGAE